uniref:Uncharacterized protein n=1 Tax=Myotis myotis TaxID=51298 RepID=A0A7J7YE78_MYOMY|nr:hypothetical protein mMyoMyo1_011188 [Myotis myotis]
MSHSCVLSTSIFLLISVPATHDRAQQILSTPVGPQLCPSCLCHQQSSENETHFPIINPTHFQLHLRYLDTKLFIPHLSGTLLLVLQICHLPSLSVVVNAKCSTPFITSVDGMKHCKFPKFMIELKHLARNLIYCRFSHLNPQ